MHPHFNQIHPNATEFNKIQPPLNPSKPIYPKSTKFTPIESQFTTNPPIHPNSTQFNKLNQFNHFNQLIHFNQFNPIQPNSTYFILSCIFDPSLHFF